MSYKPGTPVFNEFTVSAANVFAAFVGSGIVAATISGYGGGGGGGGGAGGEVAGANTPGPGGGGGGGALNQSMTIQINLDHHIDVVVGAGGTGGAAGPPAGSGSAGGNGGVTYLIDQDAVPPTVLAAFGGATGGSGGVDLLGTLSAGLGGAFYTFNGAGSFQQRLSAPTTGFVANGAPGTLSGGSSVAPGNDNVSANNTTAVAPLWIGGTNGATAVGNGGGGGGGGAGVGGNGGNGGNGGVGAPGSPGLPAGPNTGAGGGAGGGGNTGQPGGPGAPGGSGLLSVFFTPPK